MDVIQQRFLAFDFDFDFDIPFDFDTSLFMAHQWRSLLPGGTSGENFNGNWDLSKPNTVLKIFMTVSSGMLFLHV
jgi:hypothetical protein